jgi:glycosyltransferase involved in cell wall biosynthesis
MARLVARVRAERLPRVVFTGRVLDAALAALIDQAMALLFPSSFEGFGLPPIEALSRGCPVVASDLPVLREGLPTEGVFFFRNGDADDMIRSIDTVVRDPKSAQALAQAAVPLVRTQHDWQKTAERTLEVYERVCHRSPHASRR